jgi:hypothetical protein
MFNKIRNELIADDGKPLTGKVEVDETGVHGRPRGPKMTKKKLPAGARSRSQSSAWSNAKGGSSCA